MMAFGAFVGLAQTLMGNFPFTTEYDEIARQQVWLSLGVAAYCTWIFREKIP